MTLDVLDRNFKQTIINIVKEIKITTTKELKGSVRTMCHQIENINKETEIMTKNQREIMELKIITEMKNSLDGLNIRFEIAVGKNIKL